jgi:lysophospholipase
MILCAPMMALHPSTVKASPWVARFYAEAGTRLGFGGRYVRGGHDGPPDAGAFETNPLTSDRERWSRNVELAAAAPHLALGSATIGWARAAFRSMDQLAEPVTASRIVIPMLIFVAGGDQIVDPGAVDDFASRLKNATRILLPTAKHEILQETDLIRSEFWAAFDAYLGVESLAA